MTAAERPAGRPACGARPAGAPPKRAWVHDPALIREALAWRETHGHAATAVRFGIWQATLSRWRQEAREHAPAVWPSDEDIAAYRAARPRREHERAVRSRWEWRRRTGPLMVDSVGTQRRLRALSAIGWRYVDVAERAGATRARISHLSLGLYSKVHRDTAAAIADVYDRLSMTPGPSARTATIAAGRGWAPPLAWDDDSIDDPKARPDRGRAADRKRLQFDEIAVQRAMHGDVVALSPAERAEAVRRLTAASRSAAEIADLLRTTPRSVTRHRSTDTSRRTA